MDNSYRVQILFAKHRLNAPAHTIQSRTTADFDEDMIHCESNISDTQVSEKACL